MLVLAFLCGVMATLLAGLAAVVLWVYSQPVVAPSRRRSSTGAFVKPQLPKRLQDVYAQVNGTDGSDTIVVHETCQWFNIIVDFIFRELRDSPEAKRYVMKKINKEFRELMMTRTEGKMLEQLTVREYSLGTSLPVVKSATIMRIAENELDPIEMEIAVEVEYTGGFHLAIDADLVFNKVAYVSLKVLHVCGNGCLQFSREPYSHWSFSFYSEPVLKLHIESQFEGRSLPQLNKFIESQFRRWVKKKYTLPNRKMRFKPFFNKWKPQSELLDVYVHDQKLTVGTLKVEVVECTRLPVVAGATSTYCTADVASYPWKPQVGLWRALWPVHEVVVDKRDQDQHIGVKWRVIKGEEDEGWYEQVIAFEVYQGCLAYDAGLKKGDIVIKINNMKVLDLRQATKLLDKAKGRVTILVQRPPSHLVSMLIQRSHDTTAAMMASDVPSVLSSPAVLPASADYTTAHASRETKEDGAHHASSKRTGKSRRTDAVRKLPESDHGERPVLETALASDARVKGRDQQLPGLQQVGRATPIPEAQAEPAASIATAHKADPDTISLSGEAPVKKKNIRKRTAIADSEPNKPSLVLEVQETEEESSSNNNATGTSNSSTTEPAVPAPDGQERDRERPCGERDTTSAHTRPVPATTTKPSWNEVFTFPVKEHHHYLNVCVWSKLKEGMGDLPLGHVTISLMDIVLECMLTSSGHHHQRYVLMPAQPDKAGASRAVFQATSEYSASPRLNSKRRRKASNSASAEVFAGDILLKFHHTPFHQAGESTKESRVSPEAERSEQVKEAPSARKFGYRNSKESGKHNFISIEIDGATKCDICYKRIWGFHLHKCELCSLVCHKKCSQYCMKEVSCSSSNNHSDINAVDKLMETSDEDYAVYMNSSSADVHRKIEQLKRAPVVPRGVETTDSPEASNGSQEASDEVVRQLVSPQEGAGQESDNSDPCVEDEVHVGFGDDEVVKSKPLLPGLMEDGSLSNEESDSSDGESSTSESSSEAEVPVESRAAQAQVATLTPCSDAEEKVVEEAHTCEAEQRIEHVKSLVQAKAEDTCQPNVRALDEDKKFSRERKEPATLEDEYDEK